MKASLTFNIILAFLWTLNASQMPSWSMWVLGYLLYCTLLTSVYSALWYPNEVPSSEYHLYDPIRWTARLITLLLFSASILTSYVFFY